LLGSATVPVAVFGVAPKTVSQTEWFHPWGAQPPPAVGFDALVEPISARRCFQRGRWKPHPELIFELDGQSVAEPKHWSAEKNGNGAQSVPDFDAKQFAAALEKFSATLH
jgi:hypothetical protein